MSGTTKTDHALERLVFFSDAVFAIAITLLVIEVHVPELPKGSPDQLYWHALYELIPSLVGYFFSFGVIGIFWIGHHRAFTLSRRYSNKILGWNMALLGVIAFMPFTTAFLTHNMAQRVPTLVYCFFLFGAGLLNVAVIRTATGPAMVDPAADPLMIAYVRRRSMSVVLGALTALAVSWFEPRYGQMALVSIGLWRRIRDSPLALSRIHDPRGHRRSFRVGNLGLSRELIRGRAMRKPILGRIKMLRKSLNLVLVSAAVITIVACNTVSGAGDDLKSASNAVSNEMHKP